MADLDTMADDADAARASERAAAHSGIGERVISEVVDPIYQ